MKLTGLNEDERHCCEVAGYYYSGIMIILCGGTIE